MNRTSTSLNPEPAQPLTIEGGAPMRAIAPICADSNRAKRTQDRDRRRERAQASSVVAEPTQRSRV
jgi:hypothetical protein